MPGDSSLLIDWDLAVATGRRLVRPGPPVTEQEAAAVVAELRRAAVEADRHVREFTGLSPAVASPGPAAGRGSEVTPAGGAVAVVDRAGWIQANADGFRAVIDPLVDQLLERHRGMRANPLLTAVGSRVTGVQVGALLAYLAGRVLGQYELFLPAGQGNGRLTLVAPNIVATERALGVQPHDFRLWVALHEVTHRTQFAAVPWLREHVRAEISAFLLAADLDPAALVGRLRDIAAAVSDGVRGREGVSLLEAVQTPEQRVVLGRLTGLMSLVEGHGEFVMDGVGPDVVPTVAEIRRRFDHRRRDIGPVERAVRRLLGIDLKMRQYAEGHEFVRQVVQAVGMAGFNRVWTSPQTLPTAEEIRAPAGWVARVVGADPAASA